MSPDRVEHLRAQLGGPHDGALLRFSLGNALLSRGETDAAVAQLRAALAFERNYSAAWKALGAALTQMGAHAEAMAAYRNGIATAEARGDKQAEKEMRVFLRRLERGDAPAPMPSHDG